MEAVNDIAGIDSAPFIALTHTKYDTGRGQQQQRGNIELIEFLSV